MVNIFLSFLLLTYTSLRIIETFKAITEARHTIVQAVINWEHH